MMDEGLKPYDEGIAFINGNIFVTLKDPIGVENLYWQLRRSIADVYFEEHIYKDEELLKYHIAKQKIEEMDLAYEYAKRKMPSLTAFYDYDYKFNAGVDNGKRHTRLPQKE